MDQHPSPKILMVLTLMAFKKALKIWFFTLCYPMMVYDATVII